MDCAILGLGTAVPRFSLTQVEAMEVAKIFCHNEEKMPLVPALYRQTGIQTRHMIFHQQVVGDVLNGTSESKSIFLPSGKDDDRGPTTAQRMGVYVQEAGPLGVTAARQALTRSGLAPGDFTHLVTVSCTGFSAPGLDVELIRELGLLATIQRTHVGFMGCHGAVNALRVARAFTGADPGARVLVCAVELCSLHYFYGWNPKQMVANALFADGAAAVVCVPAAEAPADAWHVVATGSCLFPNCEYAMTWNVGDHGFDMTLSTRVPHLIADHLRPWLEEWLGQNDLTVETVPSWAIHPGGPRILSAVAEAVPLKQEDIAVSREVLAERGNMSSPTILFILDRLQRRQAPLPCVVLAFGPGLVVEAALLR